jgi:hypothetical protein
MLEEKKPEGNGPAPRSIGPELLREITGPADGRWAETVRDRLLDIAQALRDRAVEMQASLEAGRDPLPPLPRPDVLDFIALYRDDADFLDQLAGGRREAGHEAL